MGEERGSEVPLSLKGLPDDTGCRKGTEELASSFALFIEVFVVAKDIVALL